MALMSNPRLQTKQAAEVLSRLDPSLAEMYAQLPSELAAEIFALMRIASSLRIHPNRVLKFAFLRATARHFAQRDAQGKAVSKDHERRSKLELAGGIHGLDTGYRDDAEAKRRYRSGRKARQRIMDSLEGIQRRWRAFEQIAERHRSELPEHIQSHFSIANLREIGTLLQRMGIAADLEGDLFREKAGERELTDIAHTYILWRLKIAPYRGQWKDMQGLASVWKMSPSGSVKNFRTVVTRISKRAASTFTLNESWESVLSEKM
jgi:hypothetical protein